MLKLRVITALVLLSVLLPLLFQASPKPFMLFALVLVSAGAWEWGRLNGCTHFFSVIGAIIFGTVLACLWVFNGLIFASWVWAVPALIWVIGGGLLLRSGVAGWSRLAAVWKLSAGFLALGAAWVALAHARTLGINFLMSLFALVWAADVFAYFGGRLWGNRKLAPTISPGKSWAGVYSGVVGVMLVAAVWIWIDRTMAVDSPSLYTRLMTSNFLTGTVFVLVLTGMSVVGDLVESLVKRSAGFKDSSNLLPGHGGVLDRVDALLPVLPIAMLLISL